MGERTSSKSSPSAAKAGGPSFGVLCLAVLAVVSALLCQSFLPGQIQFSNDGPLGRLVCEAHQLPGTFTGAWQDLNSIGYREGGATPNITFGLRLLLSPVLFAKFYAALSLLLLGVAAGWFFRRLGLTPWACLVGALAATLNSSFFSAACWGVASHAIMIAMIFLALGALSGRSEQPAYRQWVLLALAGLAVGMAVSEGADIGALFSLLVAVYIFYQAVLAAGSQVPNVAKGLGKVAVVAVLAALLATQSLTALVNTQIEGIAGTSQDIATREKRWNWATQFSLPKREALSLIIPGLFGYRMGTPEGGGYWGAAGRDAAWIKYFANGKEGDKPTGFVRFTGGGIYAGILVALVALWAAARSTRRDEMVFSREQRRWIWFWSVVCLSSLLLAFGRYAPFYRLVYALPYASTMRNPTKFLHVVSFALVILFAYGVDGIWRAYLRTNTSAASTGKNVPQSWWARLDPFDRRWLYGCMVAVGLSLVGWVVYASQRAPLQRYLEWVEFSGPKADSIAGFSIRQVGYFVVLLGLAVGVLSLLLSGRLSGPRATWGPVLIGLFLVIDLGRANLPWIIFWDYQKQYASNLIVDILRQRPYEHRVACLPRGFEEPEFFTVNGLPQQIAANEALWGNLYRGEWAQHLFFYYNIQSLDVVQLPLVPQDLSAFEKALTPHSLAEFPRLALRRWQLTNARYLLGSADLLEVLNQALDPIQKRFRMVERFETALKPGILEVKQLSDLTVVASTNGRFALFEFTGALPRAKLYTDWQVSTNESTTLKRLVEPSFDPQRTLVVAGGAAAAAPVPGQPGEGTVEFERYAPKNIVLKATAVGPSVLLLNDRFDPNWKVLVDGRPQPVLRCNYLMRGVALSPGAHRVEFRFEPPHWALYVSLATIGLGLVLLGLAIAGPARPSAAPAPAIRTQPTSPNKRRPKPAPAPSPVAAAKPAGVRR